MSPQESCASAESGILAAQNLLLDPRPDTIEQSLEKLSEVIAILENLAAKGSKDWDPSLHLAFRRVRSGARNLALQIEHGSNLVRGWMQLRFGAGYTRGGLPEFTEHGAQRLFEV